jgi:hypothetical protein
MIGAFARKLGAHRSASATDYEKLTEAAGDAPPERFVERIAHEGGDVIFTPLLENLRAVLGGRKTLPPSPENVQAPSTTDGKP